MSPCNSLQMPTDKAKSVRPFQTSQTLFYSSKWNSHNVVIVINPKINSRFWLKVIFLSIFSKLQDVRLVREDEVQKKALQEYDLMQEK